MSSSSIQLNDTIATYLQEFGYREPPILAELREETAALPNAVMQISPEQGAFMANLIRMSGARRTLEVGTFTGYSALAVALALPEEGMVYACDVSEEWTAIGQRYWQAAAVDHKIELHIAPALDTLAGFIADPGFTPLDFVFIDADKVNYHAYFEQALQLTRSGAVIAIDNVLWSGAVADPARTDENTSAIRAFNKALHEDPRVHLSMVPIGDGLTLAVKR